MLIWYRIDGRFQAEAGHRYNSSMALPFSNSRLQLLPVSLVLALLVLVLSCRQPLPPAPVPALRVRVLTTDPVDQQLALEAQAGLARIKQELNADVGMLQGTERQRRTILRQLGEAKTDLIFCFGSALEAAVYTEAGTYPDTRFVLLPGSSSAGNVASISFQVEEAAFVGGVLAALLRQNHPVGVIEGEGGPWLTRVQEGFAAGLHSRARHTEIITAKGTDAPWQLAKAGVGVALYRAEHTSPEVLAAAHDAGILLIVTDAQALTAAPDVVLALIVADLETAMVRLAQEVLDGGFSPRVYAFDLGSGVVDLRLADRVEQLLSSELRAVLDRARADVTAGWVEIEQLGI